MSKHKTLGPNPRIAIHSAIEFANGRAHSGTMKMPGVRTALAGHLLRLRGLMQVVTLVVTCAADADHSSGNEHGEHQAGRLGNGHRQHRKPADKIVG